MFLINICYFIHLSIRNYITKLTYCKISIYSRWLSSTICNLKLSNAFKNFRLNDLLFFFFCFVFKRVFYKKDKKYKKRSINDSRLSCTFLSLIFSFFRILLLLQKKKNDYRRWTFYRLLIWSIGCKSPTKIAVNE